jgi:hypothetical protein
VNKQRMDINKKSHQFVIVGLTAMVQEDGLTPHEAFDVLEDIKRQTWHALADIRDELRGATK